jgi:site-specific DNA recombinase
VDRQTFDAVQAEMARRNAGRSPSRKNAPTGRTSYASKYALSERLVCGECGTLYRRCVWAKRGKKRTVWRCVSRLDYGTKYCHNSPTLDEEPLQKAILAAINSVMGDRTDMARQISGSMELALTPTLGQTISLADIQRRLDELESRFNTLLEQAAEQMDGLGYMTEFQIITNEIAALKAQRTQLEAQHRNNAAMTQRLNTAAALLTEWDETIIRQLVDTVKVISAEELVVYLQGSIEITQKITG